MNATDCEALDPQIELYEPRPKAPSAWDRELAKIRRNDPAAVSERQITNLGRTPSLEKLLETKEWRGSEVTKTNEVRTVKVWVRAPSKYSGAKKRREWGDELPGYWFECQAARAVYVIRHPSGAVLTWVGPVDTTPDVLEDFEQPIQVSYMHGKAP